MLRLFAIVLLVLWVVGFCIIHIGALIHALLVLAVVLVLGNLLRGIGGRRAAACTSGLRAEALVPFCPGGCLRSASALR